MDSSPWDNILSYLPNLDFFPKTAEEVKVKTSVSGLLTVVCASIIIWLFSAEFYSFVFANGHSSISVDTSSSNKLKINLDITFPGIPCNNFGIDLVDSAGDQRLEIESNLRKEHTTPGKERMVQLKGCRVRGYLLANKVKGEFHVAFGRQAQASEGGGGHTHRFTPDEIFTFNCSHIINHLSFGDYFPNAVQPLDGVTKIVRNGLGRYQYFIQIVPTIYKYRIGGMEIISNQYSYTENNVNIDISSGGSFKQPGVFFRYEFSPYLVTYHESSYSFSHFITRLLAIIGGIWSIFGILSSFVWYIEHHYLKKPIRVL